MTIIPHPEEQPLMTISEVAACLGWSSSATYRRAQDGTLPVVRTGPRGLAVPTALLREWLGLPTIPPPSTPTGTPASVPAVRDDLRHAV